MFTLPGGLFLDKTQINLNYVIDDVSIDPFLGADGNVYTFTWDEPTQKIIICGGSGGGGSFTEVPNGTDLSAILQNVAFEAIGL